MYDANGIGAWHTVVGLLPSNMINCRLYKRDSTKNHTISQTYSYISSACIISLLSVRSAYTYVLVVYPHVANKVLPLLNCEDSHQSVHPHSAKASKHFLMARLKKCILLWKMAHLFNHHGNISVRK